MEAYVATFIISTIPNLVLFFVPSSVVNSISATSYMLCFAAGALLGDVFLHSLPHLLGEEEHSKGDGGVTNGHIDHHDHDRGLLIGGAVLAGFLAFMMVQQSSIHTYSSLLFKLIVLE